MAEFMVKTEGLRSAAASIGGLQSDLDAVAVKLGAMQLGSVLQIKASTALIAQIGDCKWAAAHQADDLGKLANSLEQLADLYDTYEKNLKTPKTQEEASQEAAHAATQEDEKKSEETWSQKWLPGLDDIVNWLGKKCVPIGLIYGLTQLQPGEGGWVSGVKTLITALGNGTKAIFADPTKIIGNPTSFKIKGLLGLNKQNVNGLDDAAAKWLESMKIGKNAKAAENIAAACKWAGYALSFVGEYYDNKGEYDEGGMSKGRMISETIIEGATDVGLSIGVGILVGAALPAAAPAIVVGAVGAGVVWIADTVTENLTGQDIDEWVSDIIIDGGKLVVDTAKDIGKAIGEGVCNGANAIGKWAKGLFA